jgi:hypothetical protein
VLAKDYKEGKQIVLVRRVEIRFVDRSMIHPSNIVGRETGDGDDDHSFFDDDADCRWPTMTKTTRLDVFELYLYIDSWCVK